MFRLDELVSHQLLTNPMPRPRLVSDDEILSAVRRGVLEQGPQVSLDLIADRLGVTAPALFKRFGSRNALLLTALKPSDHPEFIEILQRGPDKRPFEDQLVEVLISLIRFQEETYPCVSALRESGIPKDQIRQFFRESPMPRAIKAIGAWLQRADAKGLCEIEDSRSLSLLLLGAMHMPTFVRRMLEQSSPHPEEYARSVARMISRGLHLKRKAS
jgi:AcrR family transcriptional regulator